MKLKRSIYNIEITKFENGDTLLFNTFSCAFGKLNKENKEIYDSIEDLASFAAVNDDTKKLLETMSDNGFILENNIDERERLELWGRMTRYNTRNLSLTIAPTLDCNMACPYCYEDKKGTRMDSKTKEALIGFVEKYFDSNILKQFSVTWYGGEPLLEKDTIRELSKAFIDICDKRNIPYYSSIITNGVFLDLDTAKMLKSECRVHFAQITIDGTESVHNKRRIMKDRSSSFKTITDNIEAIKDIMSISVRMNVDRTNIEEAEKLAGYIIDERKWGEKVGLYFAPVHKQTDACRAKASACYSPVEFGEIDSRLIRLLNAKGGKKSIDALYPRSSMVYCTAVTASSFVVDPLGDLYKCWNIIGLKDKCIGNVFEGTSLNGENIKWLGIDLPEKCRSCSLLPLCQGGCPFQRMQNGNQAECIHKTVSFKENLLITYEEYSKEKENNQAECLV